MFFRHKGRRPFCVTRKPYREKMLSRKIGKTMEINSQKGRRLTDPKDIDFSKDLMLKKVLLSLRLQIVKPFKHLFLILFC